MNLLTGQGSKVTAPAPDAVLPRPYERLFQMIPALLSREEVAVRGKALYEQTIRRHVETEANVGKMVIIDIESGDYAVDDIGIASAERLHANHPNARLYGIRIGYDAAEALGGVLERTAE